MAPWLVAGAVTLVVIVVAALLVFRFVLMTAGAEADDEGNIDDDLIDEMDAADELDRADELDADEVNAAYGEWRTPGAKR
jgi:hypothetical protein